MKKLVIAFILLLLVTAATVAALQYMGLFGSPQPEEQPQKTQAQIDEGKVYFIEIDPILVPLVTDAKVAATIHVQVKLEVMGSDNKDTVLHEKPRLSHAFFQDLYGYIPRMLRKQERLDLFVLKKRMELIANKTVGQGVINAVLVQSVMDVPSG